MSIKVQPDLRGSFSMVRLSHRLCHKTTKPLAITRDLLYVEDKRCLFGKVCVLLLYAKLVTEFKPKKFICFGNESEGYQWLYFK